MKLTARFLGDQNSIGETDDLDDLATSVSTTDRLRAIALLLIPGESHRLASWSQHFLRKSLQN